LLKLRLPPDIAIPDAPIEYEPTWEIQLDSLCGRRVLASKMDRLSIQTFGIEFVFDAPTREVRKQ